MTDDMLIIFIVNWWLKWYNDPSRYQKDLIDCFGSIDLNQIFSYDLDILRHWYEDWQSWHNNDAIEIGDHIKARHMYGKEYEGTLYDRHYLDDGQEMFVIKCDNDIKFCSDYGWLFKKLEE